MPIGTAAVSNDVALVIVKDNDNTTVQFTNTDFTAMENAALPISPCRSNMAIRAMSRYIINYRK
ncbi:MAG: hypothetical protein R3E08_02465 [Thiotrichaceae bacterium]